MLLKPTSGTGGLCDMFCLERFFQLSHKLLQKGVTVKVRGPFLKRSLWASSNNWKVGGLERYRYTVSLA